MSVPRVCFRFFRQPRRGRPPLRPTGHLRAERRGVALAAGLALLSAGPAAAQTEWRVDGTLTRLKPAGFAARSAVALSAAALQEIGPFTPILSGAATVAGDSVAAAQIGFGVRMLPPWTNRAPFELGGIVALYGLAAGDRGQSRVLYAQQRLVNARGGFWISGAIGQIDRVASFASNAVDVGTWFSRGSSQMTLSLSTTATNDRDVFTGTDMAPDEFATTVRVLDAGASLLHVRSRFEVDLALGMRWPLEGLSGTRAFGTGTVAWRMRGRAWLVAGAGYRLADPLRGTPEWRYVSAGIRISNTRDAATAVSRAGVLLGAERLPDGRIRLVVGAPPESQRVEVRGTFTDWAPVALTRGADGWSVVLGAAGATHRVQVRVNGGPWRVPLSLPAVEDEFGQRAGILVIER
jgi:hypothetical protein